METFKLMPAPAIESDPRCGEGPVISSANGDLSISYGEFNTAEQGNMGIAGLPDQPNAADLISLRVDVRDNKLSGWQTVISCGLKSDLFQRLSLPDRCSSAKAD